MVEAHPFHSQERPQPRRESVQGWKEYTVQRIKSLLGSLKIVVPQMDLSVVIRGIRDSVLGSVEQQIRKPKTEAGAVLSRPARDAKPTHHADTPTPPPYRKGNRGTSGVEDGIQKEVIEKKPHFSIPIKSVATCGERVKRIEPDEDWPSELRVLYRELNGSGIQIFLTQVNGKQNQLTWILPDEWINEATAGIQVPEELMERFSKLKGFDPKGLEETLKYFYWRARRDIKTARSEKHKRRDRGRTLTRDKLRGKKYREPRAENQEAFDQFYTEGADVRDLKDDYIDHCESLRDVVQDEVKAILEMSEDDASLLEEMIQATQPDPRETRNFASKMDDMRWRFGHASQEDDWSAAAKQVV